MAKKGRQGGRVQKQEESIGGRKGGKEDERRKGREAGRDRTRYEVSVVTRGARDVAILGARARVQKKRERERERKSER